MYVYKGGDSYSKVGGLMRGEARQHAIAHYDLGGSGGMQNFLGVFWVSEMDSDALSCLARYIARLLYVNCVAQRALLIFD